MHFVSGSPDADLHYLGASRRVSLVPASPVSKLSLSPSLSSAASRAVFLNWWVATQNRGLVLNGSRSVGGKKKHKKKIII